MSPGGTAAGAGTLDRPWDLQTALDAPPAIQPGDTVWLREGTYTGTFMSHLRGSNERPIVVRTYPGEHATLDGASAGQSAVTLAVAGQYTWFWGFEITSSDLVRVSSQAGSAPTDIFRPDAIQTVQSPETGPGLRFINLVIHDARQGISFWKEAVDSEIYGCLIYYNGWQGTDRGHGHGIYTQNQIGTKRLVDNVIFEQFGGGIQAYGSAKASLDNFWIEGNTNFENGSLSTTGASDNLLVGGGVVTNNDTIAGNMLYYDAFGDVPARAFNFGYVAGCTNGTVSKNYVAVNAYFGNCVPVSMSENTFRGQVDGLRTSLFPANTYAHGGGLQVFIRPNAYERGRAHVTIFNWDLHETVSVDLSSVLSAGDEFEIRNAQDFFGPPVLVGSYAGSPVTLPMTGLSVASPVSWPAPRATGPEFNVFVVLTKRPARTDPVRPGDSPRPPLAVRRPAKEFEVSP